MNSDSPPDLARRDREVLQFYLDALQDFLPDKSARILVCGGGHWDRVAFSTLGYTNVHISGMDLRVEAGQSITTAFENAESLSFADNSFDFSVMRGAIHHCRLPHKVITELYRVSKQGFLALESRDCFLVRAAQFFGLAEAYEVAGNFAGHGVNGTDIPNFIYRWTEREIEKTIKSFAPEFDHKFSYRYGSVYPVHGFTRLTRGIVQAVWPVYFVLKTLFPRQQNQFAFFVAKPSVDRNLKPWLKAQPDGSLVVDREWIAASYTKRLSK